MIVHDYFCDFTPHKRASISVDEHDATPNDSCKDHPKPERIGRRKADTNIRYLNGG